MFWRRRAHAGSAAPEIEPPAQWVDKAADTPQPRDTQSDTQSDTPHDSASDGAPPPSGSPAPQPDKVEPPLVAATSQQSDTKSALQIKAQALTLSRSLMNATLNYRLELMNLNNRPIGEVSVKADLVTAHGKAPVSEQVASEDTILPESAFMASIEGRGTHEVKGTFSLPINAIRPITQRGAALYVPLLRLRVDAIGMDPIICTFVVGVKPPERGAKLQPFRLDEMAQTYRNIGLRLID